MLKGGRVPAHAGPGSIGESTYQISSKEVCIKSMALGVRKHLLWWHLSKQACVCVCVCGVPIHQLYQQIRNITGFVPHMVNIRARGKMCFLTCSTKDIAVIVKKIKNK